MPQNMQTSAHLVIACKMSSPLFVLLGELTMFVSMYGTCTMSILNLQACPANHLQVDSNSLGCMHRHNVSLVQEETFFNTWLNTMDID
jgi:hypothetical protein